MLFPVRAGEINAFPFERTVEAADFERRIRGSHPHIRVRRNRTSPSFAIFALDDSGMALHLTEVPHLSDSTVNWLDRSARQAHQSRLERIEARERAEREAEHEPLPWNQHDEDAVERAASMMYQEGKDERFATAPWQGHGSSLAHTGNVFVPKYDEAKGCFDDGFVPAPEDYCGEGAS